MLKKLNAHTRDKALIDARSYPYNIIDDYYKYYSFDDGAEDATIMKKMLAAQPDPVEYAEELISESRPRTASPKAKWYGDALLDVVRMRYRDGMTVREIREQIGSDPAVALDKGRDALVHALRDEMRSQKFAREGVAIDAYASRNLLNCSLKQIAERPGMNRVRLYKLMKDLEENGVDTVSRWGVTPSTAYDVAHRFK